MKAYTLRTSNFCTASMLNLQAAHCLARKTSVQRSLRTEKRMIQNLAVFERSCTETPPAGSRRTVLGFQGTACRPCARDLEAPDLKHIGHWDMICINSDVQTYKSFRTGRCKRPSLSAGSNKITFPVSPIKVLFANDCSTASLISRVMSPDFDLQKYCTLDRCFLTCHF